METTRERPFHVLPVPRWTVIIHAAQMVLAIVILGLDAYGIRWIAYNVLIFSLVAAILTLGFCIYIVGSTLFLHSLYNMYIVLALHLLMVIFWIVDMGLVANLARIWSGPQCSYSYYYDSYYCNYGKRDLSHVKREETTVNAYYGALAAGAFFGSVQFATWVASAIIFVICLSKHRSGQTTSSHAPPAYVGHNSQPAVPVEQKFGHTVQPQPQPQQYSAAQSPQPQYTQPVQQSQGQFVQQPVYSQQQQQPYTAPYPQEPVNRVETVSPVSQGAYPPQNSSELATPQHTGSGYNPNASELSTQK